MHCPACQVANRPQAKFCDECGCKLADVTVNVAPSHTAAGERKHATVLFSDLSGYTAITEKLDPEEVKALMGRIFAEAGEIIEKYEGTVERFFGDEIMALFGVPVAHEDDPVRAVRAAMEIHAAVASISLDYEVRLGNPLSMHTGINTGLVVTGDERIGKGRHGLTGDAINLAKRLTGLGKSGEIIVGTDTHRQAGRLFDFEKMQSVQVKGKADLVHVYRLIEKSGSGFGAGHRPRIGSERQIYSAMVGRDKELETLVGQTERLLEGSGGIINVIGEAGIGKSRLIAEYRKSKVLKKVALLEGRAISIGRNLSFHPIIDLLRNWARIGESDTPQVAFGKLKRSVKTVAAEEADEIVPFVAMMMGMKLTGEYAKRIEGIEGEALERLILKNIRDLMAKASGLNPVAIVMEDLHWADTSSIDLLISLYRLISTRPILFINVFRSGYKETGARFSKPEDEALRVRCQEIALEPLDAAMSETLIGKILNIQGLPLWVKNRIVERAGGNPFFIEEVVRSFIDTGAIVFRNGRFEATERIDTVEVPGTIQDVLLARIDRLDEHTRSLVKIASVIGRNFFRKILVEVTHRPSDIDERLDHLKDIQLIREQKRQEEIEYLFKHALAQEAAYGSILHQKRKEIHLDVAVAIEQVFHERLHEFYGLLALHYTLSEEWEKTEQYLVKAGEEALRSSASSEALHFFQEALELYKKKYGNDADSAKLADFEKNIALAFFNKAQWEDALEYFDKVLERLGYPLPKKGPAGIVRLLWDSLVVLKAIYWRLPDSKKTPGDQDNEAFELVDKALGALAFKDNTILFQFMMAIFRRAIRFDLSNTPILSLILLGLSVAFSYTGLSFRLSNRLLEISKRHFVADDLRNRMAYVIASFNNYPMQGEWAKMEYLDEDLLNSSLRVGDFWSVSVALWWYGLVKLEQGEFKHLEKVIGKLNEIGEEYNYPHAILYMRILKTDCFIKKQKFSEAFTESEKGILLSRKNGDAYNEILGLGLKAETQQLAGNAEGARDSIAQALELYQKQSLLVPPVFGTPFMTARFFIEIEELKNAIRSRASTDLASIRKRAYQSGQAAVRNSRKYAPYKTKIFRLMGIYYWLVGKQAKALKWWKKTIQEGERLGARPDLARTYFEVGKRLLEPQSKNKELNGISAQEYLEKARALFEEMDLKWDLAELNKVSAADH